MRNLARGLSSILMFVAAGCFDAPMELQQGPDAGGGGAVFDSGAISNDTEIGVLPRTDVREAPREAGTTDTLSDVFWADATIEDAAIEDAAIDDDTLGGTVSACKPGKPLWKMDDKFFVCPGPPNQKISQCQAKKLCQPGFELCPAKKWLNMVASKYSFLDKKSLESMPYAWLAGCALDASNGGKPSASNPKQACKFCSGTTLPEKFSANACESPFGAPSFPYAQPIGVTTSPIKHMVQLGFVKVCSHWAPAYASGTMLPLNPTTMKLPVGALCCKP